jgi:hypothetical protein
MKENCLTRALDQWVDNPAWFWLWYNSNHVISIELYYNGSDLVDYATPPLTYLPLSDFGYDFLVKSFSLTPKYQEILREYLDHEELGKIM